tara:strand:- start:21187 stop:21447 length:261 start_codon:yes stop_codon:yes gene_type:complete
LNEPAHKRAGNSRTDAERSQATQPKSKRPKVKQQTVYLPLPVYEQLRTLAFEERRKMHDYLLEGLDRVFTDRGLPPVQALLRDEMA